METLINYYYVVPAQAGIQKNQIVIDSRLRGNDIDQSIPIVIIKQTGSCRRRNGFL